MHWHGCFAACLSLPHGCQNQLSVPYDNSAAKSIAYSDGASVRFATVSKLEVAPDRVCQLNWGATSSGSSDSGSPIVTALAFDAVSSGTLYVGSGTGEVRVRLTITLETFNCFFFVFHPAEQIMIQVQYVGSFRGTCTSVVRVIVHLTARLARVELAADACYALRLKNVCTTT